MMKIELKNRISSEIVQEADNLSKETGISFRTLLEVLYRAYLTRPQERGTPSYCPPKGIGSLA